MEAIFFAIIAYLTWGSGVFAETIVARKLSSYSLLFWSFLLSFLVTSLYIPFAIHDLANLTVGLFTFNLLLALMSILLGTLFYYEALKIETRALVGTIASSFPFVTVVLSILFLGERVTSQQLIAIIIVLGGLFLSIFDIGEVRNKNFKSRKGLFFAVMAMVMWGSWFAFIKYPVDQIGWFWPNYIAFLTFPLIFILLKLRGQKLEKVTQNNALAPFLISTILVRIAEFSYNLGISKGLVAIVAPIAGANPTLFVVLAFLFLKDPIKKQQLIGIFVTLFGIILLSIFAV
ncbi:MAG: hypothetical protein A2172_02740 [Candidatus Woykebacteria bacterium RBG_13_40_15]|uniref:EamA domain-containing protein n=1 Tax=Candidatus Woykebacteria bacterium RBG_13_40_15 TaxID=1802593 RepID=A0A1G1WB15_9BACT|nr:MAG: hypothetical protein A2172_02740 [Candidatus Woykebacteria bacterium RBG_13_40_15]